MSNKYTDLQLLNFLQNFYCKNGISPSSKNFYPNSVVYWKRFGSWSNALKLAGVVKEQLITPKQLGDTETKHDIKTDWIIGFWEGDGSFSSFENQRTTPTTPPVRYPQARLNQSEYEILEKTRLFFNDLGITGKVVPDLGNPRATRPHYQYAVSGQESFILLANLFNGRLKSTLKQEQFREWCDEFGFLDFSRLIRKVVLLLSGGMDSATLLAYLLEQGLEVYPVIINYHQKHNIENRAAIKLVKYYQDKAASVHDPFEIEIDLSQFGHSALTDTSWEVPVNMKDQIKTVVPFRNAFLVTLAASFAYIHNINDIYITPVMEDFEAYRDCRPYFYNALQEALRQGSTYPSNIRIQTPFIDWWKKDIVKWGIDHKVPYGLTHSCYNGLVPPCGKCPACREREDSFTANGVIDPLITKEIPCPF